jgi:hypothetical protein
MTSGSRPLKCAQSGSYFGQVNVVTHASAQLHDMDRALQGGGPTAWSEAHRRFHRLLASRSGTLLIRSMASYALATVCGATYDLACDQQTR